MYLLTNTSTLQGMTVHSHVLDRLRGVSRVRASHLLELLHRGTLDLERDVNDLKHLPSEKI